MFRSFLLSEFPDAGIEELSGSNNLVYLVRTSQGAVVAKHVTDTDIPLSYLAEANARLAEHLPVQRILRVYEKDRGDPFDAVFAEYVEGRDLASVLAEETEALPEDELALYLRRFVLACRELPRMHDGFGMYKRDAPINETHLEFVTYYAKRYWSRARPLYAGTSVASAVDDWLADGLATALRHHPAPFHVTPIDANTKNFVVGPDGRIVVLNVPIAALSTPAHAVAAVSLHLRNSKAYQPFLDMATEDLCTGDQSMVPHFELWQMLGVLSFYAVREPERQHEWRNWGSPVPLDTDFKNLVESHLMVR